MKSEPVNDEIEKQIGNIFERLARYNTNAFYKEQLPDGISPHTAKDMLIDLITSQTKKAVLKGRIDELKLLTQWEINDTGDEDYDVLYARHKRSYDNRITELTDELEGK